MTIEDNKALVRSLSDHLRAKGHKVDVIEGPSAFHLNRVDDTFVGVWVIPALSRRGRPALRVGFGEALQEYPNPQNADLDVLAKWVLDWLSLHGEMSRRSSATPLSD